MKQLLYLYIFSIVLISCQPKGNCDGDFGIDYLHEVMSDSCWVNRIVYTDGRASLVFLPSGSCKNLNMNQYLNAYENLLDDTVYTTSITSGSEILIQYYEGMKPTSAEVDSFKSVTKQRFGVNTKMKELDSESLTLIVE